MNKEEILSVLKEHYKYMESLGYNVIGIFLQGSQNYNLDIYEKDYSSDIDTKCLIIPTLDDLIKGNKMVSCKYDFRGGQIDVKDIRVMMDMWKKQNQSYLEILFTEYKIINPKYEFYINQILDLKKEITKMNPPLLARCISGMSQEKVFALEHIYPATIKKIEKYGYDPKQLASIVRLTRLMEDIFIKSVDFDKAIWYENGKERDEMLNIKKGKHSLNVARVMAEYNNEKIKEIRDKVVAKYGKESFNSDIYNQLSVRVYDLVEFGIKEAIKDVI